VCVTRGSRCTRGKQNVRDSTGQRLRLRYGETRFVPRLWKRNPSHAFSFNVNDLSTSKSIELSTVRRHRDSRKFARVSQHFWQLLSSLATPFCPNLPPPHCLAREQTRASTTTYLFQSGRFGWSDYNCVQYPKDPPSPSSLWTMFFSKH